MSDPVVPPSSSSSDLDPPPSPPSSANPASQTTPPAAATTPSSKTSPPTPEPPFASVSPPTPLTPPKSPEASTQPPSTNVESPPPLSQPEPPVTSPPQTSSETNVDSPSPPPPANVSPQRSSSEPNVESPAPPPPPTSQPEPPVTSPPQSSSEPNVESPAPPPPPTSPPQSSSEPNVKSPAPPPPFSSPPKISSEPNVKSPAPPPPPTSQPSPPPQDTNKASTSPLPADPTPPPDSTKTSSPEKPPPTTDVAPSSSPPQSPPPSSTKSHVTSPPPPPPSPPRSSTTNEITNAETPNQPDQKPTDQAEQKDPDEENTTTSSINVGTKRNMLNFPHLRKKKKKEEEEQSNQSAAKDGSNKGESDSSCGTSFKRQANETDLQKMKIKLDHMQRDLKKLHIFEENLRDSMKKLEDRVQRMIEANKPPSHKPPSRIKVDRANRDIKMLSVNIPSAHKLSLAKPSNQESLRKRDGDRADATLPNLHLNQTFLRSSEFKEYQQLYNQLDEKHKLCLLCFAVFPKHEVIKKRLMMHWWLGEGFLEVPPDPSSAHKEVEDLAEETFKKLMHVGFIQPVYKKRRQEVHSFKMHPVVHSAVVILAKSDGFFDYNSKGNPTIDSKLCARACLLQPEVTSDAEEEQDELEKPLDKVEKLVPENLETLFNISKIILDFSLEWFSKMKKLNVLYLGRWQASPYKHHIEVESSEFLDGLKNLKRLRFLSLQGISRIFELPKLLRHLTNLRILDLRACHNLEVLPKEIGMLKRLTHLDISECYLLDRVPKEIALLTELQVLKGFVICCLDNEKACTLGQLTALANLRKLSITTSKKTFPSREDLNDLSRFQKLTHLRIVWGHDFKALHSKKARTNVEVPSTEPLPNPEAKPDMGEKDGFLNSLRKLDLESFPEKRTPIWLMPCNVKNLEKLYIKGGELEQLCPITKVDKWDKVEVLCLKFLSNLKIEWKDLQASFPKLYYLEKARCPNLNVYPCDEDGIWVKSEKKKVATSI